MDNSKKELNEKKNRAWHKDWISTKSNDYSYDYSYKSDRERNKDRIPTWFTQWLKTIHTDFRENNNKYKSTKHVESKTSMKVVPHGKKKRYIPQKKVTHVIPQKKVTQIIPQKKMTHFIPQKKVTPRVVTHKNNQQGSKKPNGKKADRQPRSDMKKIKNIQQSKVYLGTKQKRANTVYITNQTKKVSNSSKPKHIQHVKKAQKQSKKGKTNQKHSAKKDSNKTDGYQTVPASKKNRKPDTVTHSVNTGFHSAIFNRYEVIARGAQRSKNHEEDRTKALNIFEITHKKSLEIGRKHRRIKDPLKLNSNETGVIYALVDEKGSARYVGQTSNTAAKRELGHWYSRHLKKTTIAKLIKKRGSPLFAAALEKVNIGDSLVKEVFHTAAHAAEAFWIRHLNPQANMFRMASKAYIGKPLSKKDQEKERRVHETREPALPRRWYHLEGDLIIIETRQGKYIGIRKQIQSMISDGKVNEDKIATWTINRTRRILTWIFDHIDAPHQEIEIVKKIILALRDRLSDKKKDKEAVRISKLGSTWLKIRYVHPIIE